MSAPNRSILTPGVRWGLVVLPCAALVVALAAAGVHEAETSGSQPAPAWPCSEQTLPDGTCWVGAVEEGR